MIPFYDAAQVHAALPWDALVHALREAFQRPVEAPRRHAHRLSAHDTLLLMPAWSEAALGVKVVTVMPQAPQCGGRSVQATYLLLDRHTGAPRAMFDGEALTVRRTAAASVLAASILAREDADTLLMVGTGALAPYMVQAYLAMRPAIRRVFVWGRDVTRATSMVQRLVVDGVTMSVATDLEAAVRDASIVCCATTATAPLVFGRWLSPGTHLDLVGGFTPAMREVDDTAILRSRVVVDTFAGALSEAGDLVDPIARGVVAVSHVTAELADLLPLHTQPSSHRRRDEREITLFKSVGTALEDLAAATLVLSTTVA